MNMSTGQGKNSSSHQEYSIRVPKNVKKRYHVMRFNGNLGVDFGKWTTVKMERENNLKEYRGIEEDAPKFGAGSEYGKEAREEARRKKLGIASRKYKPDDQPWILKAGGSIGKKFKGIREGGVSENAAYYVFTHAPDGAIEAFPLNEWYKFQPIQRYKALSAEEAEQEFGKRNRVLNYFSLMLRKRLKGDEDIEADEGEEKAVTKKTKDLKISDMDEWISSDEDDSSENNEKDEEEKEKPKKNKKVDPKKKKPKRDTDLEAFEDSDDGDNEGRELDYISDSSDSEPENPSKDLQSVSEEKALRKLLTSDEDSDDEEQKSDKERSNDENEEKQENKEEKNKKKHKKKETKKKKEDSSSDFSSDSSDSDTENKKSKDAKKDDDKEKDKDKGKETNSENSSRSASPMQGTSQNNKRKLVTIPETIAKKPKFDTSLSNYIPGSSESGITEDAVRRYLMRKPMTTTELLQKFKSKKTGLSSNQLVNIMTQILKKINPVKQTIKGKMYLSIKA